jgi:hypothetical protein
MRVPRIATLAVFGDLLLDFGLQIEAIHFGDGCEVQEDVGQFLAKVGEALAPGSEGLSDLRREQADSLGPMVRLERSSSRFRSSDGLFVDSSERNRCGASGHG